MGELSDDQVQAAEAAGASDQEISRIAELKAKAGEFQEAIEHLLSIEDAVNGTELEDEHARLLERGQWIRDKIETATNAIDESIGWARGAIGLDGLRGLGNLGVVWFIPLAVIGAAITALTWWLSDYAKFAKKFREQQRIADELKDQGVNPVEAHRQAAAAVASTVPGWLEPLQSPLALAALAAGGFLLLRARK